MFGRVVGILLLCVSLSGCLRGVRNTEEIHPDCPRIPTAVFEKVGLDATVGALKFGELVTLGNVTTKTDLALLSAISQSARDDQVTGALICAATKRGELTTPEQIAHAWDVARFYRTTPPPTPEQVIEFHKQFPFPSNSTTRRRASASQNKSAVHRLIGEGYALKEAIEGEYRFHRKQNTFAANMDTLIRGWKQRAEVWVGTVEVTLNEIDPIVRARFKNYRSSSGGPFGENVEWGDLDSALNGKLNFLNQLMDRLE
jgi:hypothetical protein